MAKLLVKQGAANREPQRAALAPVKARRATSKLTGARRDVPEPGFDAVRLLTIVDAAAAAHISRTTLYVHLPEIGYVRVGRKGDPRIPLVNLRRWIEKRTIKADVE